MSAILEPLNALSAAGLSAVLNTLWLALAVAAVIWLALRLMPRVNAATRHAVWWAVLALVVLMPLATLLPRPAPSVPSPARTEKQIRTRAQSSSSAVKPLVATDADAPAPPLTSAPLHALYSRAAAAPRVRVPIEFHPGNWPSRLLFLWMAVSCLLLGRIVQSYLHLRGLRNRARPASAELVVRFEQRLRDSRTSRAPQVLVSDEVISPLAAGFLPPVVILPDLLLEKIGEAELDYVLFHELAHVVRRDDWSNLMGRLASAAFVLHPVAAWVLRRIEREREIACDDWVVAATGSTVHYAATLARLFEFCCTRRRELLATGMAHRSSNLGERIEILLRPRFHSSPSVSLPGVSFCVAACLALLSFGVRVPGWVAFAKDSTVAVAYNQAVPQSQISARRIALAATLSPTRRAQSSATPPAILTDQDKTWRHEWKLTRHDSSSSKVRLSLISRDDDGNDRTNTQDVPLSSLAGFSLSVLDHDGPVSFEYVRDSGRILCDGRVTGGRASGPFTVVLNPSFVSALQKMGYAAPHDDEAFSLVTSDVTLGYARAVRDTGLTSSVSDLIGLQDHGVSSDYVRAVRQEGFTNLTASDISNLRDHGVEPNYLKAIKAAGPNLPIDEIDSLYDHGVKPDYYKSMKASVPQLSIEQIDSLFDHGVEPDSYKGFASADPKLSIEEIDSLRDHGVKPEYYRSMKSVDPNLSIEQIDSLFNHGVEPDSYKGFASANPKLSVEEIDSLRDHGVEPEFYQGIRAVDSTLSIEDIDSLRDHGVEPEYLKEIRALPDGFSISDISELRDHGITAKYIRDLHAMGVKNLTAAQIVHLRDGG
ncbi:MAG: M56 family metallopeptidase [Acidobacteria bacterium Pan2503]|uniref:M56 family metallopeptidase n=1 Tax=Candidatus Acidiferrum panamense TaxID=2741543 RepID=A0A7V8NLN1_9BACT|nr:M56 family metallopeptidase [Candidatus Acidoferrum panamensis]